MNVVLHERPSNIPLQAACSALGLNRSSVYARRRRTPAPARTCRKSAPQPRALSSEERQHIYHVLTSAEFCNQPPAEIYHTLPERGEYLYSISTLHRILREHAQNGERRDQRAAQHHAIPRLAAHKPNEVWTWDCTKLPTRARGVYLTLYVVLDLFSRFVLAWMVSRIENTPNPRGLNAERANAAAARHTHAPCNLAYSDPLPVQYPNLQAALLIDHMCPLKYEGAGYGQVGQFSVAAVGQFYIAANTGGV